MILYVGVHRKQRLGNLLTRVASSEFKIGEEKKISCIACNCYLLCVEL